jgi:hypothetical protein
MTQSVIPPHLLATLQRLEDHYTYKHRLDDESANNAIDVLHAWLNAEVEEKGDDELPGADIKRLDRVFDLAFGEAEEMMRKRTDAILRGRQKRLN